MSIRTITTRSGLKGTVSVPGDKSISHRSVMLGAIARGTTEITNFLEGADCLATIDCFRQMGVEIIRGPESILIHGRGLHGLHPPAKTLMVGNSGTTTRLLAGILAGQNFTSVLSGDASLNIRPMDRIIQPLCRMGAAVRSQANNSCAPLVISPGKIHGIHHISPVASAQVKSAILLAGLYGDSETTVTEPALSRNHTELMLQNFGAAVSTTLQSDGRATAAVAPCKELYGQQITVPGDISSAAYFIAAALLVPGSQLLLQNVGTNCTRAGFLKVCRDMGADITLQNQCYSGGEATADILVKASQLNAAVIEGDMIPTLIDELPIIAIMAAHASGTTVIRDAAELKVKETNRIDTITWNLQAMGGQITPTADGMIIAGGRGLTGATVNSYEDHRIAMAFAIAGLCASGQTQIRDSHCVDVSYPGFWETLNAC